MKNNQELKFRVWGIRYKNWIRNDRVSISGDGSIYIYHFGKNNQNNFIIQRFAGLLDKNGREIYEGDIIKINFGNKGIGRIVYNSCSFMIVNKYNTAFQDTYYCLTTGEVIGNIFENPELLN